MFNRQILLKNGNIVDPFMGIYKSDILIKDNIIANIGDIRDKNIDKKIDLQNKYVFPGIIDMHSHLRDPGNYKDINIETQTKCAVKSGITSVIAMPNTDPVCDNKNVYDEIREKIDQKSSCEVFQVVAGSKNIEGKKLVDLDKFNNLVAVSDDGKSVEDSNLFLNILKNVKKNNLIYLSHAEDDDLRNNGVINYSNIGEKFNLKPIYNSVEDNRTYRDISIAKIVNAKIHMCHLSTKNALEIVKYFKNRGVSVTCEVTPHHFSLSDEDITIDNGIYKMNPPLRSEEDRKFLINGIKNGDVDVIATDHAPHPMKNKSGGFEKSSFGIIGFETFIPLVIQKLYYENNISLKIISKLLSYNPAQILGLKNRGLIRENYRADLSIIDINSSITISENFINSKTYNTPFLHENFKGKPIFTVINGKIFDIRKDSWYAGK